MSLWLATKLLFFPTPTITAYPSRFEIPYEEVRFRNDEGMLLHGWFFPGKVRGRTLLFLHGNAGNIGDRLEQILILRKVGWSLFIFDYRGYGGSEGKPTIEGVVQDTDAAYRWLTQKRGESPIPSEQIILWGESLGGALAVDLASRQTVGGVILQSTFTSVSEMAQLFYPFIPQFLVPDVYRSIDKIREIKVPLLMIHGDKDETVPFEMGVRLFEKAPHPKRFYKVPGGHHNDLPLVGKEEFLRQIEEFLNEAGL